MSEDYAHRLYVKDVRIDNGRDHSRCNNKKRDFSHDYERKHVI